MLRIYEWLKPYFWFQSLKKTPYDFSEMYPLVIAVGILILLFAFLLPINGYILVIIGLITDIIGVIFIIEPVVTQYRTYAKILFFKKSLLSSKTIDALEQNRIRQSQNKGMLGLRIIILGFILQIVGNYFQFLNS